MGYFFSEVNSLILSYYNYNSRHKDDVISIRTGSYISKESCQDYSSRKKIGPGQWNAHLLIEDPFDRTNVARWVCFLVVKHFIIIFSLIPRAVYCDKKWTMILSSLEDSTSILEAVGDES